MIRVADSQPARITQPPNPALLSSVWQISVKHCTALGAVAREFLWVNSRGCSSSVSGTNIIKGGQQLGRLILIRPHNLEKDWLATVRTASWPKQQLCFAGICRFLESTMLIKGAGAGIASGELEGRSALSNSR